MLKPVSGAAGKNALHSIPRPGAARQKRREPNTPCDNLEEAALFELVAQLVEQRPFKAWVLGSIPSELTTQEQYS